MRRTEWPSDQVRTVTAEPGTAGNLHSRFRSSWGVRAILRANADAACVNSSRMEKRMLATTSRRLGVDLTQLSTMKRGESCANIIRQRYCVIAYGE
jgi:hypothetical protein